jgi:hypothetical protein
MGAGFKTFTAGSILTASDVQNYLQDQSVMVFGGTAARSSAIGTANFEEGMLTYLTDVDKLQVYTGASFVDVYPAAATNQGLTLINTTSFSGVSSVSLPTNTFSTTYNQYKILVVITASTATASINARFRAAGVDYSTGTYTRQFLEAGNTTVAGGRATSQTSMTQLLYSQTANENVTNIMEASNLMQTGQYANIASFAPLVVSGNIQVDFKVFTAGVTTNFDSMTFFPTTGNISGKVMVYGYNE